jgi:hypothetical protein
MERSAWILIYIEEEHGVRVYLSDGQLKGHMDNRGRMVLID